MLSESFGTYMSNVVFWVCSSVGWANSIIGQKLSVCVLTSVAQIIATACRDCNPACRDVLQSVTAVSASLDDESETLCLLLFVTETRPCASGNSWKRFSLSDGHGAGGVELAPLNTLTYLLTRWRRGVAVECWDSRSRCRRFESRPGTTA